MPPDQRSWTREELKKPPRDWWREVPCGHPQDPVAWWGEHGPFCHCGGGLDPERALPDQPPEAPGPIVPCDKCGCYPAIPPEADFVVNSPVTRRWTLMRDAIAGVVANGPDLEPGESVRVVEAALAPVLESAAWALHSHEPIGWLPGRGKAETSWDSFTEEYKAVMLERASAVLRAAGFVAVENEGGEDK